jgi:hypothetical protein
MTGRGDRPALLHEIDAELTARDYLAGTTLLFSFSAPLLVIRRRPNQANPTSTINGTQAIRYAPQCACTSSTDPGNDHVDVSAYPWLPATDHPEEHLR